jgi:hypothetical protein
VAAEPVPNPNPKALAIDLAGPADSIEIRLYSRAMVLMRQEKLSGSWQAGWNDVPLPSSWLNGLANGHYYFYVRASDAGREGKPKIGSLVLLR